MNDLKNGKNGSGAIAVKPRQEKTEVARYDKSASSSQYGDRKAKWKGKHAK